MSPALKEPAFSAQGTLAACQQDLEEARCMADEMEWTVGQGFYHLYASWVFTSYGRLGEGLTNAGAPLRMAPEMRIPRLRAAPAGRSGERNLVLPNPVKPL